jgi:hypothetical protein
MIYYVTESELSEDSEFPESAAANSWNIANTLHVCTRLGSTSKIMVYGISSHYKIQKKRCTVNM